MPLVIGDAVLAKRGSDSLLEDYGIDVQPMNYPTVPRGTEYLRFAPDPAHSLAMVQTLVEAVAEVVSRDAFQLAA